eukprot:4731259-Lingulodinium_polyedra.AAC.1
MDAVVPSNGLVEDLLRTLRAGARLLIDCVKDDVYHERVVLSPMDRGWWVVATPDDDAYDEVLNGNDEAYEAGNHSGCDAGPTGSLGCLPWAPR